MPKKFHYVYMVEDTNPISPERFYIGVRSSNLQPDTDPYIGSPSSTYWKHRIKTHPEVFKKTILSTHDTRLAANAEEIRIHNELNVAMSTEFYNRTNATSHGFDPVHMSTYIDGETGAIIWANTSDENVINGKYKNINNGTQIAINIETLRFERVKIEMLNLSKYICASKIHMKNKTIFKNKYTNAPKILSIDDENVINGTFIGINSGYCTYKHKTTGEVKSLHVTDPLVLDGTYVGITSGYCTYKHKTTGERLCATPNDPLVLDGTYVGITSGYCTYKHKTTGEVKSLHVTDPLVLDGTYVGINSGIPRNLNKIYKCKYIEVSSGKLIRTTKNDPRVLKGELIWAKSYNPNKV